MKVNLKSGFDVHIGGEIAKNNSLPLDYFAKICSTFQDFVNEVAINSFPDESIDLDNFKVELTGFFKGSAVPRMRMTDHVQNTVLGNTIKQKTVVSNRIDKLLSLTDSGSYHGITDLYKAPQSSNAIVESMYSFMSSFGTAPVEFGRYNQAKKKFTSTYKAKKFKPVVKERLLVEISAAPSLDVERFTTVANITVSTKNRKVTKKIDKAFLTSGVIVAYNPTEIFVNNKKYFTPGLLAEFIREEDYFVLKSDLLDIIATGDTEGEAKISFAEEIDYIYSTYLSLADDQLSDRLLEIKRIIPVIIKLAK